MLGGEALLGLCSYLSLPEGIKSYLVPFSMVGIAYPRYVCFFLPWCFTWCFSILVFTPCKRWVEAGVWVLCAHSCVFYHFFLIAVPVQCIMFGFNFYFIRLYVYSVASLWAVYMYVYFLGAVPCGFLWCHILFCHQGHDKFQAAKFGLHSDVNPYQP